MATSYKLAGDVLIDQIMADQYEGYQLIFPVLFLYRHSVELHLKNLVAHKKTHQLSGLVAELEKDVQEQFQTRLPGWLKSWVLEYDNYDASSTTFRYHDNGIVSRKNGDRGEF